MPANPFVHREVLKFKRWPLRATLAISWTSPRGRGEAHHQRGPAYGQDGVEAERKYYELDDPSVLAIKGTGPVQGIPRGVGIPKPDRKLAHLRLPHRRGPAERGRGIRRAPLHPRRQHRPGRAVPVRESSGLLRPGAQGHGRACPRCPARRGETKQRTGDWSCASRTAVFCDPFIARYVSDGTIKMFAYLVLLYDPKPHPLLAVEEPENQLYPETPGRTGRGIPRVCAKGRKWSSFRPTRPTS